LGTVAEIKRYNISKFRDIPTAIFSSTSFLVKTTFLAPSLSGSRYFLTIVDDHTRAVWVYPLKSKREVAAAVLKEWMPRAQRECGHKVKKLTVSRDVKFLESLYYKEWKQQQQKLPSTPLIVEADEVQRPSRQVEVAVSEEEMSGVTEEGGAAEVEQQQHSSSMSLHLEFHTRLSDLGGMCALL
ncbi:hypothetical protein CLOM_g18355, partial [Closterium sp. NIES-68]